MLLFGSGNCQSRSNPGFDSYPDAHPVAHLDANADLYARPHLDSKTDVYFCTSHRYRNANADGNPVHDLDALANSHHYGDLSAPAHRHTDADHDVHPIAIAHGNCRPNGDAYRDRYSSASSGYHRRAVPAIDCIIQQRCFCFEA